MANNQNQYLFDNDLLNGFGGVAQENDAIGAPVGITSVVSAASALNNPLGDAIGVPSGVTVVSAENNATAAGDGNVTATGVSAASAQNSPIGDSSGITAGQAAASAETNPVGASVGITSGVTAATAEHDGLGVPAGTPASESVTAFEGTPAGVGNAAVSPSGLAAVSSENNPTAGNGNPVTVFPDGVAAVASENAPTAFEFIRILGGAGVPQKNPLSRTRTILPFQPKTEQQPKQKPKKPKQPAVIVAISINGTAEAAGVVCTAQLGKVFAMGSASTLLMGLAMFAEASTLSGHVMAAVPPPVDRELESFAEWFVTNVA